MSADCHFVDDGAQSVESELVRDEGHGDFDDGSWKAGPVFEGVKWGLASDICISGEGLELKDMGASHHFCSPFARNRPSLESEDVTGRQ